MTTERDTLERLAVFADGVEANGWNRLALTKPELLVADIRALLAEHAALDPLPHRLYGDGKRLTFAGAVNRIRENLVALQNAPHEEHAGPACPICVLTNRLLRTMDEFHDD